MSSGYRISDISFGHTTSRSILGIKNGVPHGSAMISLFPFHEKLGPHLMSHHDSKNQFGKIGTKQFLGFAILVMYLSITSVSPSTKNRNDLWKTILHQKSGPSYPIEISMSAASLPSACLQERHWVVWRHWDYCRPARECNAVGCLPPMMYGSGPSFWREDFKLIINLTISLTFPYHSDISQKECLEVAPCLDTHRTFNSMTCGYVST